VFEGANIAVVAPIPEHSNGCLATVRQYPDVAVADSHLRHEPVEVFQREQIVVVSRALPCESDRTLFPVIAFERLRLDGLE
jgi:hypothetical protein